MSFPLPARIQWFWRSPPKITKNRCRSLLNETAHQYHAPSLFWQSSGSFLEGFGGLLGLSSAQLGRSWGAFGLSWGPLRCLLASFWVLLETLGRIWALIGASVLDFGWSWAPPGWVLASSGAVSATIFEGDALIAAGIPAWHSHWHFVTSLRRGGTCAAHGIGAKLAYNVAA